METRFDLMAKELSAKISKQIYGAAQLNEHFTRGLRPR